MSWSRSGAPALRCTICCWCLGFEVVPQQEDARFVAGVLSRSCAPARKCTICCRCLGLEVVPHPASTKMYDLLPQNVDLLPVSWSIGAPAVRWRPSTKMYDLLPVSWSRSGALRCTICCRCLGQAVPQNVDLPVSWSIGAPTVRCTICCRCLDLEVAPQQKDVRFVAGVLVSKWCPSTKMYDLLPVSWSRSGTPALRCTFCCRCLGQAVPQNVDLLPVSSSIGAPAVR